MLTVVHHKIKNPEAAFARGEKLMRSEGAPTGTRVVELSIRVKTARRLHACGSRSLSSPFRTTSTSYSATPATTPATRSTQRRHRRNTRRAPSTPIPINAPPASGRERRARPTGLPPFEPAVSTLRLGDALHTLATEHVRRKLAISISCCEAARTAPREWKA